MDNMEYCCLKQVFTAKTRIKQKNEENRLFKKVIFYNVTVSYDFTAIIFHLFPCYTSKEIFKQHEKNESFESPDHWARPDLT